MKIRVVWTEEADSSYQVVRSYLKNHWGISIANNFSKRTEEIIELIVSQPRIGESLQNSDGVRKKLVTEHNTIYYKLINDTLNIIKFVDNRQEPKQ